MLAPSRQAFAHPPQPQVCGQHGHHQHPRVHEHHRHDIHVQAAGVHAQQVEEELAGHSGHGGQVRGVEVDVEGGQLVDAQGLPGVPARGG